MNYYKRLYKEDVTTPSPTNSGNDDHDAGGNGQEDEWQKQVKRADDGSYYYLDEKEEYVPCDEDGNEYD